MKFIPRKLLTASTLAVCLASCTGVVAPSNGAEPGTGGSGSGSGGSATGGNGGSATGGAAGTVGAGAGGGGASGAGGSGGSGGDVIVPPLTGGVLAARVRRMTNAEYDESVHALLGTSKSPGQAFAPDTRQSGFTVNSAQVVDPVLVGQLQSAAEDLAHEVVTMRMSSLGGCASGDDCAKQIITSFGTKAFRRPITTDESADLFALYQLGSQGGTFAEGIERVVIAVLQSAGFLYLTEIGDQPPTVADVALNGYEVASSLSYLFWGAPPDDALLQAAKAGTLSDAAEREKQARRLFADNNRAPKQRARIVKEWLGLDKLGFIDKTPPYQDFQKFRPMMEQETTAFIERVFTGTGTGLSDLLSSTTSVAPSELASSLYEGKPRRGILNQAAFLSVYGHASESDPIHRGVTVLRKVACIDVPSPASLNIKVTPPVPDQSSSVRQRFTAHVADAVCKQCHTMIDNVGFTFETYDGMGKRAAKEFNNLPNNLAIDSATDFVSADPTFLDGHYANSEELATKLAGSSEARECFATNLYHFASAQPYSDEGLMAGWKALPAAQQGSLVEALVAYVKSPSFVSRKVQP